MPDVKVGDEVRVFPGRFRPNGAKAPSTGWPGTVIKVGRKYATATYTVTGDGGTYERTVEFDIETWQERNAVSNYATRVTTPEVADRTARWAAAEAALRKIGLSFISAGKGHLTLEQIEALAEVAKTFQQED